MRAGPEKGMGKEGVKAEVGREKGVGVHRNTCMSGCFPGYTRTRP